MPARVPFEEGLPARWPRSPTAVAFYVPPRSFLIEASFEGRWNIDDSRRRPADGFVVQQIGGFFDEDVAEQELAIDTGQIWHRLDRRYLARLWPHLWKLPTPITVERHCPFNLGFPAKAIVVIAGIYQP